MERSYPKAKVEILDIAPVLPKKLNLSSSLAIKSLQHPYLRISDDPAQDLLLSTIEMFWVLSIHWLYKFKWNCRHKIPVRRKKDTSALLDGTKAYGELLLSIFNLCEALHAIGAPFSAEYSNAGQWFDRVAWEAKNSRFQPDFPRNKTEHAKGIRREIEQLNCYENPYDEGKDPHTWRLIQAALEVHFAKIAPTIVRKLFRGKAKKDCPKGFIGAYSAWAAKVEGKNRVTLLIENGKLLAKVGAGNRYLEIPLQ